MRLAHHELADHEPGHAAGYELPEYEYLPPQKKAPKDIKLGSVNIHAEEAYANRHPGKIDYFKHDEHSLHDEQQPVRPVVHVDNVIVKEVHVDPSALHYDSDRPTHTNYHVPIVLEHSAGGGVHAEVKYRETEIHNGKVYETKHIDTDLRDLGPYVGDTTTGQKYEKDRDKIIHYSPPSKSYLPPTNDNSDKSELSNFTPPTKTPKRYHDHNDKYTKYSPPSKNYLPPKKDHGDEDEYTNYSPPSKNYLPPEKDHGHFDKTNKNNILTAFAPPSEQYLPPHNKDDHPQLADHKRKNNVYGDNSLDSLVNFSPPAKKYLSPPEVQIVGLSETHDNGKLTVYTPPSKNYLPPQPHDHTPADPDIKLTSYSPPSKNYLPPSGVSSSQYHEDFIGRKPSLGKHDGTAKDEYDTDKADPVSTVDLHDDVYDKDRFSHTLFRGHSDHLHLAHAVGSRAQHHGHLAGPKKPVHDISEHEHDTTLHLDNTFHSDDNVHFPAHIKHLGGNYPDQYFSYKNPYQGLPGNQDIKTFALSINIYLLNCYHIPSILPAIFHL